MFRSIKVIPNPAINNVEIILDGNYEGLCYLKLRNALGEIQIEESFDCVKKKHSLDLHHIVPGMYFVEVNINGSNKVFSKIIKMK
jgi:hypothetical protein